MLEIKILKCLNVAQISFILSIIVYQEVSWKYIHIFCTLEKLKKKFPIDAHTNTGVRIYWHARFRQKLVIFLQGDTVIFYDISKKVSCTHFRQWSP